jgi:hypothetical protein
MTRLLDLGRLGFDHEAAGELHDIAVVWVGRGTPIPHVVPLQESAAAVRHAVTNLTLAGRIATGCDAPT